MKLYVNRVKQIIREEIERSLDEIRASGLGTFGEFPPIPLSGVSDLGYSVQSQDFSALDADPDDESDDIDEIIDMLADEFSKDEIAALMYLLARVKKPGEKSGDYIKRSHGNPFQAMDNLVKKA